VGGLGGDGRGGGRWCIKGLKMVGEGRRGGDEGRWEDVK